MMEFIKEAIRQLMIFFSIAGIACFIIWIKDVNAEHWSTDKRLRDLEREVRELKKKS